MQLGKVMSRIRWAPLVMAAYLVMGTSAAFAELGPQRLIEQTTGKFLKEVAAQREVILENPEHAQGLVDKFVTPHIDVQTVGRWMLGKYWRKSTPEQRRRFVDELRKMLVRSYAASVAKYEGGDQIQYLSERISDDGKNAVVRTRFPTFKRPQPADVTYRLHHIDGEWKVYDVVIEGVSIVTTYRSTFRSKLERQSIEELIQELSELNRKN